MLVTSESKGKRQEASVHKSQTRGQTDDVSRGRAHSKMRIFDGTSL